MGFLLDRQEVTGSNPVLPTSVILIFYKEFNFYLQWICNVANLKHLFFIEKVSETRRQTTTFSYLIGLKLMK